jgi:AmmeMemoRadiSam system protein B
MPGIRRPAVAGSFYPEGRVELGEVVERHLADARAARSDAAGDAGVKALIAPHAGYVYSGPIAASAYARVAPDGVERVVLLGPAHRVPLRGAAAPEDEAFATPLGTVPVDAEAVARASSLRQVVRDDRPHRLEHSLEVHLPFLQKVLGPFSLVPFVVGDADPEQIAELIELLWGGDETLVVVSSDLSHYEEYETARRMDAATSRAIEKLEPEAISYDQACGRIPVQGLLLSARRHGLHARAVDLRNSGDTAGPRDRVVGYGSYVFA